MNIFEQEHSRRQFLEFMGRGAVTLGAVSALGPLSGCFSGSSLPFQPLSPQSADQFMTAEGFDSSILIRWQDQINAQEKFGFNNDFLAFIPTRPGIENEGYLWVNHEYPLPTFVSQSEWGKPKTKEQVLLEQDSVGGSILHVKKDSKTGEWKWTPNHPRNKRITGMTMIPIISDRPIEGAKSARGTLGNCAGGVTPWGSILTCEENYDLFYGERLRGQKKVDETSAVLGWNKHFPLPPEHYGWVVEINVLTGEAKKLTSLGRFAHESATVRVAGDGRCVVYSGDDKENEFLYKFIAEKPGSLEKGTLYVANTEKGQWISLSHADQPELRKVFQDQTDVLIHAREAAKLLGATPLDRPEDIDIDPKTGAVIVALTNNLPKGNYFGSLLKVEEKGNDPLSLEFQASTFLSGGPNTGFACPDNLAFDRKGNLWFTSDISGSAIGKGPYAPFGNNGLFYVPLSGKNAGKVFQIASAPIDAEITGPCFSPDGKTLFLSIQHPGETTRSLEDLKSHWPDGGASIPKPAVVALSGKALEKLVK